MAMSNLDASLFECTKWPVVADLIRRGANPRVVSDEFPRYAPLHDVHTADIAQVLLSAGAEADARNADGATPLHRHALIQPQVESLRRRM